MTVLFLFLSQSEADPLAASFRRLVPESKIHIPSDYNESRSILETMHFDLLICHRPRDMVPRTAGPEALPEHTLFNREESGFTDRSSVNLLLNPPAHLPPILFIRPFAHDERPGENETSLTLPLCDDGELLRHLKRLFPAKFSVLLVKGSSGTVHQLRTSSIDAILANRGGSAVYTTGNASATTEPWTRGAASCQRTISQGSTVPPLSGPPPSGPSSLWTAVPDSNSNPAP